MFKIAANPQFRVVVGITPAGDGEKIPLPVVFRHREKSAVRALAESLSERNAVDVLDEIIVEWEADEPYSREALARLLENYPVPFDDLMLAFFEALLKGREKN